MTDTDKDKEKRKSVGTIRFFTHGFEVTARESRVAMAARSTLTKWAVYEEKNTKQPDKSFKKETVLSQLYGAAFPCNKRFWFHKGQFRDFQSELLRYDLAPDNLEIIQEKVYKPSTINYSLKPGRILRDYQVEAKDFSLAPVAEGDHFSKLVAMPVGTGKALADHSEVITPDGLAAISSLSAGDSVLGPDGHYVTVLGVYPQEGVRQNNRIVFEDARFEECDDEHIWTVRDDEDGSISDMLTSELKAAHAAGRRYSIPLVDPCRDGDVNQETQAVLETLQKSVSSLRRVGDAIEVRTSLDPSEFLSSLWYFGCIAVREGDVFKVKGHGVVEVFPRSMYDNPEDPESIDTTHWLKIAAFENAGYSTMTCIEVDSEEKLFVTANFIVTHNTVTSCGIAAENSQRLVVSVLPKYYEKWLGDIVANLDLKPKQVMGVEKTTQLIGLIGLCKEQGAKKLPPVIVITLSTIKGFTDAYEEDPLECVLKYGCAPHELWELLDCGLFAIDEAHEYINWVFKAAMYLHGPKFIAMSGTMRTEDAFDERIQNTLFPQIKRFLKVKMKRYIDVEFISYNIDSFIFPKIRYQAMGRTDYSHSTFEKSLMKNPRVLRDFMEMVCLLLDTSYEETYQKKDKAIVYVSTVMMADAFVQVLQNRYPMLDVVRYCAAEGDSYSDFLAGDLVVSTIQSAGTGVDIPNLTVAVCTVVINSSKSNIQVLGRLRELPNDRKVTMFMPFCAQIQKHCRYMAFRYDIFKDITKSIRTLTYGKTLGRM